MEECFEFVKLCKSEVQRLTVEDSPDGQVNGLVVDASLRDCGPCPGQDATTIQSPAKPVPLPVKVGAVSKTTLAERGGYTMRAAKHVPRLTVDRGPDGQVNGPHLGARNGPGE